LGATAARSRLRAAFAVVTLVAGAGLLVFADPAWAHAVGALALIACAVTVFALAAGPPGEEARDARAVNRRSPPRFAAAGTSIQPQPSLHPHRGPGTVRIFMIMKDL
jgi:hypothetical protein